MSIKSKYLTSASLMIITSIIVKIISAVYKIPLTSYIGAVGRGYFASAYNLFLPINAIAMGAFPITLSRLVSKYDASSNTKMLYGVRKASRQIFAFVGVCGTMLMVLMAKPYSILIASSPKCVYTILILAPCVLFSSLGASYEDYYEGLLNMLPTSVSQLLDATFKMIFGLIFARLSMAYFYNEYLSTGMVLGERAINDSQALSIIYPYTSAFAMCGAFLGSFTSLAFVFIYDLIHRDRITISNPPVKPARMELLSFAFPIMISCAVQSLFQFLDTAVVQYSLSKIDASALQAIYNESITISNTQDNDLVTYIYGLFSAALDFKNLIPGITISLGVCAVPAISRAYELNDKSQLSAMINSVFKYTSLLSLFGGVVLMLCSKDILTLFYKNNYDIVVGCDSLVKGFGLTVIFYSISAVSVFSVQAIGKPEKSIKPYIVSGVIRVVLNYFLVQNEKFVLIGVVISGAIGYFVMSVWNMIIVIKNVKIRLNLSNIFVRPIFAVVITYFVSKKCYQMLGFFAFSISNLLLKIAILSLIFCILCFLLKLLNFKEFFLHLKAKNMA